MRSFFQKTKSGVALATAVLFLATNCLWSPDLFAFATAGHSEILLPYQARLDSSIRFSIPGEFGKIDEFHLGKDGQPALIQIQTAHGHYEAQQQIRKILHHLAANYGVKTVLVEGSAFKLEPQILNFFPNDPQLTAKVADELTKHALVKGPELFLLDEIQKKQLGVRNSESGEKSFDSQHRTQDSELVGAYGIEKADLYRENGNAFVDVLTQKEKTANFLADMNEGIERLSAPYLSDALRTFLKRQEAFEKNLMPFEAWLSYLKEQAQKVSSLDLEDAASQVEWPMMVRIFKIRELSSKLDLAKFPEERNKFLAALRRFLPPAGVRDSYLGTRTSTRNQNGSPVPSSESLFVEIERLLRSEQMSQQLPDPETSLLFEDMVKALPRNFNYDAFPNVRYYIGLLLLQSEIKAPLLMEEGKKLTEKIADKLAKSQAEKQLIGLLKDHCLLQKLFALELTSSDYKEILSHRKNLWPSAIIERFTGTPYSVPRVKAVKFEHIPEIDRLFDSAMKFYAGVKARDGAMEEMIEKRLKETGADKVAVITGGFHSEPFKNYFSSQGYTYALISPKLSGADKQGYDEYIQNTLASTAYGVRRTAQKQTQNSVLRTPYQAATREFAYASLPRAELLEMGVDSAALARSIVRAGMPAIENPQDQEAFAHQMKTVAGLETQRSEVREGISKQTVHDINVSGKRIIARVDFNVKIKNGKVVDDTRLRAAIPTIQYLLDRGATTLTLMSHLGDPEKDVKDAKKAAEEAGLPFDGGKFLADNVAKYDLAPVAARLGELLGRKVEFAPTMEKAREIAKTLPAGGILLLPNTRFDSREKSKDDTKREKMGKELATFGDVFVNDAFGTAHRAHASTEAVTHYLPAVAGFLMEKELDYLQGKIVDNPAHPFVAVVGGSKLSSKIPVLESLLQKVDKLVIGGGMAYTFLKAQGRTIGNSLVENDMIDMAKEILIKARDLEVEIILPVDHVAAGEFKETAPAAPVNSVDIPDGLMGMDVGPLTVKKITEALAGATTVLVNGPLGVFEFPNFAKGTKDVFEAIADLPEGTITVVGGGDSVTAVNKFSLAGKMSHVSTGGGASLELVEGKVLPGVAALMDKKALQPSSGGRSEVRGKDSDKVKTARFMEGVRTVPPSKISLMMFLVRCFEIARMFRALMPVEIPAMFKTLMLDQILSMIQAMAPNNISEMSKTLTSDQISAIFQAMTPEQISAMFQALTPDQISAMFQALTPKKISAMFEAMTADKIFGMSEALTPDQISTMVQAMTPKKISAMFWVMTPQKMSEMFKAMKSDKVFAMFEALTPKQISAMFEAMTPKGISTMFKAMAYKHFSAMIQALAPKGISAMVQALTVKKNSSVFQDPSLKQQVAIIFSQALRGKRQAGASTSDASRSSSRSESRSETSVEERVRKIVMGGLKVAADKLKLEANFRNDFSADSLTFVELIFALEDEFGIEIPIEDADKLTTVKAVVNYIRSVARSEARLTPRVDQDQEDQTVEHLKRILKSAKTNRKWILIVGIPAIVFVSLFAAVAGEIPTVLRIALPAVLTFGLVFGLIIGTIGASEFFEQVVRKKVIESKSPERDRQAEEIGSGRTMKVQEFFYALSNAFRDPSRMLKNGLLYRMDSYVRDIAFKLARHYGRRARISEDQIRDFFRDHLTPPAPSSVLDLFIDVFRSQTVSPKTVKARELYDAVIRDWSDHSLKPEVDLMAAKFAYFHRNDRLISEAEVRDFLNGEKVEEEVIDFFVKVLRSLEDEKVASGKPSRSEARSLGDESELNAEGYKKVARSLDVDEMAKYVLRVIESMNYDLVDGEDSYRNFHVQGFARHYVISTPSDQSFATMQENLRRVTVTQHWLAQRPRVNIPDFVNRLRNKTGESWLGLSDDFQGVQSFHDLPPFMRNAVEETLIDMGNLKETNKSQETAATVFNRILGNVVQELQGRSEMRDEGVDIDDFVTRLLESTKEAFLPQSVLEDIKSSKPFDKLPEPIQNGVKQVVRDMGILKKTFLEGGLREDNAFIYTSPDVFFRDFRGLIAQELEERSASRSASTPSVSAPLRHEREARVRSEIRDITVAKNVPAKELIEAFNRKLPKVPSGDFKLFIGHRLFPEPDVNSRESFFKVLNTLDPAFTYSGNFMTLDGPGVTVWIKKIASIKAIQEYQEKLTTAWHKAIDEKDTERWSSIVDLARHLDTAEEKWEIDSAFFQIDELLTDPFDPARSEVRATGVQVAKNSLAEAFWPAPSSDPWETAVTIRENVSSRELRDAFTAELEKMPFAGINFSMGNQLVTTAFVSVQSFLTALNDILVRGPTYTGYLLLQNGLTAVKIREIVSAKEIQAVLNQLGEKLDAADLFNRMGILDHILRIRDALRTETGVASAVDNAKAFLAGHSDSARSEVRGASGSKVTVAANASKEKTVDAICYVFVKISRLSIKFHDEHGYQSIEISGAKDLRTKLEEILDRRSTYSTRLVIRDGAAEAQLDEVSVNNEVKRALDESDRLLAEAEEDPSNQRRINEVWSRTLDLKFASTEDEVKSALNALRDLSSRSEVRGVVIAGPGSKRTVMDDFGDVLRGMSLGGIDFYIGHSVPMTFFHLQDFLLLLSQALVDGPAYTGYFLVGEKGAKEIHVGKVLATRDMAQEILMRLAELRHKVATDDPSNTELFNRLQRLIGNIESSKENLVASHRNGLGIESATENLLLALENGSEFLAEYSTEPQRTEGKEGAVRSEVRKSQMFTQAGEKRQVAAENIVKSNIMPFIRGVLAKVELSGMRYSFKLYGEEVKDKAKAEFKDPDSFLEDLENALSEGALREGLTYNVYFKVLNGRRVEFEFKTVVSKHDIQNTREALERSLSQAKEVPGNPFLEKKSRILSLLSELSKAESGSSSIQQLVFAYEESKKFIDLDPEGKGPARSEAREIQRFAGNATKQHTIDDISRKLAKTPRFDIRFLNGRSYSTELMNTLGDVLLDGSTYTIRLESVDGVATVLIEEVSENDEVKEALNGLVDEWIKIKEAEESSFPEEEESLTRIHALTQNIIKAATPEEVRSALEAAREFLSGRSDPSSSLLDDPGETARAEMRGNIGVKRMIDETIIPKLLKQVQPREKTVPLKRLELDRMRKRLRDQVSDVCDVFALGQGPIAEPGEEGISASQMLQFFYGVIPKRLYSKETHTAGRYAVVLSRNGEENAQSPRVSPSSLSLARKTARKLFAATFAAHLKTLLNVADQLPQDVLEENFPILSAIPDAGNAPASVRAIELKTREHQLKILVLANLLLNMTPAIPTGPEAFENYKKELIKEAGELLSVINPAQKLNRAQETSRTARSEMRDEGEVIKDIASRLLVREVIFTPYRPLKRWIREQSIGQILDGEITSVYGAFSFFSGGSNFAIDMLQFFYGVIPEELYPDKAYAMDLYASQLRRKILRGGGSLNLGEAREFFVETFQSQLKALLKVSEPRGLPQGVLEVNFPGLAKKNHSYEELRILSFANLLFNMATLSLSNDALIEFRNAKSKDYHLEAFVNEARALLKIIEAERNGPRSEMRGTLLAENVLKKELITALYNAVAQMFKKWVYVHLKSVEGESSGFGDLAELLRETLKSPLPNLTWLQNLSDDSVYSLYRNSDVGLLRNEASIKIKEVVSRANTEKVWEQLVALEDRIPIAQPGLRKKIMGLIYEFGPAMEFPIKDPQKVAGILNKTRELIKTSNATEEIPGAAETTDQARSELRKIATGSEVPLTVPIPDAEIGTVGLVPRTEEISVAAHTIRAPNPEVGVPVDLHQLVNAEILTLIREYYFRIVPLRVRQGFMTSGLENAEESFMILLKALGVRTPSAMAGMPETEALGKLIPGEGNLVLSNDMTANLFPAAKSKVSEAKNVGGTLAIGQDMLKAFISKNPRALYYLLKSFALNADSPALVTVGSPDLIPMIMEELLKKGVVDASEFEMRRSVFQALKDGKVFKVIELKAGEDEASVFNKMAQDQQGGMATLHLNAVALSGLKDGVHFAFGENLGSEDLMVASALGIAVKSLADLIRNVPDVKIRGELLTKFVTENLPGVRKSGANAFIVEHVAQLAQQFVAQAAIAQSA